jgi:hypothetical protein
LATITPNPFLGAGILSEGRFFKMKKHKAFLVLGMLVLALAFALVLGSCDTGAGGDGTGTENTGSGGNSGNNTGGNSGDTGDNTGSDTDGGTTTSSSVPTGVKAAAQSSSSISISWNAVSGATGYKVYYEKGAASTSSTKNLAGTTNLTSFVHTGLDANTTYYYYVKAVNSAGESGYSSSVSAKTSSKESDDNTGSDTSGNSDNNTGSGSTGETTVKYILDQPIFGTCTKSGNNLTINWKLKTSGKTANGIYTYTSPSNIIIQVYNGTSFDEFETLSSSVRTFTLKNYAAYQYSPENVSGNRVSIKVYCTSGSSSYDSKSASTTYFVESNYWQPTY